MSEDNEDYCNTITFYLKPTGYYEINYYKDLFVIQ